MKVREPLCMGVDGPRRGVTSDELTVKIGVEYHIIQFYAGIKSEFRSIKCVWGNKIYLKISAHRKGDGK